MTNQTSTSEFNLTIKVEHNQNLPADAAQVASAIAQYTARILDVGPGSMVVIDGRNHISGPVTVFLRSAFVVSFPETQPWEGQWTPPTEPVR